MKKEKENDFNPNDGNPVQNIEIGTIVSSKTKKGMVQFTINENKMQMDLDKAREIVGMLNGAIEAAISDELLFKYLIEKLEMPPEIAGLALLEFREMRQGSKDTVYPH